MAGGPRKFSEKIALLNQKEAEGNAAYASVMAQVVQIRPNDVVVNQQQQQQQQPPDSNKHQKLQHQQHQQQQQQQQYQQMMGPAPYLQLPTQPESFRRAQSDSSIHQSVNNMMNNNNQMAPMMMPPQQPQPQQQQQPQQQIMTNNTNNLPSPQQQQQQQQFNYMPQQQMYQQQPSNYQPNNFQQRPGGFQNGGGQNDYNSPQIPYRNFTLPILPNSTAGAPNETNSASASPAHSPHHFNSPPLSGGGHVSPTNFLHPKLPKNVRS